MDVKHQLINPKLIDPNLIPVIAECLAIGDRTPLGITRRINRSSYIVHTILQQMKQDGYAIHITDEGIEKNGWYLTSKGVELLDKAT